ncbi:MAG: hypothetical protein HRT37_18190 [Alteromonadaceae bacterium]|nr:hypothetical protein [Alteromonadaceae bacterium]
MINLFWKLFLLFVGVSGIQFFFDVFQRLAFLGLNNSQIFINNLLQIVFFISVGIIYFNAIKNIKKPLDIMSLDISRV